MRERGGAGGFVERAQDIGPDPAEQPGEGVGRTVGRLRPQAADAARRIDHGGLPGRLVRADDLGPGEDARYEDETASAEDPVVVAARAEDGEGGVGPDEPGLNSPSRRPNPTSASRRE